MTTPCIICVAITGSVAQKSDNPAVPITVNEQIESTHEAFEEGASPWVSKAEAKKMYCLPEGTLAVCAVVEKDNQLITSVQQLDRDHEVTITLVDGKKQASIL